MLNPTDRRKLLAIARRAVHACVAGQPLPEMAALADALAMPSGAFVTLRRDGALRGCIGRVEGDRPLGVVVASCAAAAATEDPRFPPMSVADLFDLQIEISILQPLETFTRPDEIEVGRHGVLVERGSCRGLLLPQVAIEWRWSREQFLAQTCVKAGLPPDAWRGGARLFRFEAEIVGEEEEDFMIR